MVEVEGEEGEDYNNEGSEELKNKFAAKEHKTKNEKKKQKKGHKTKR